MEKLKIDEMLAVVLDGVTAEREISTRESGEPLLAEFPNETKVSLTKIDDGRFFRAVKDENGKFIVRNKHVGTAKPNGGLSVTGRCCSVKQKLIVSFDGITLKELIDGFVMPKLAVLRQKDYRRNGWKWMSEHQDDKVDARPFLEAKKVPKKDKAVATFKNLNAEQKLEFLEKAADGKQEDMDAMILAIAQKRGLIK